MNGSATLATAAGAALLFGAGCGTIRDAAVPTCTTERTDTLVLVAQSVPTAGHVPCIASHPAGWTIDSMEVRKGRASLTLDSDRGGNGALTVTFEQSCDVAGATEVPSDHFDGGCLAYRFDLRTPSQALVEEGVSTVRLMSRSELDARVRADGMASAR